MIFRKFPKKNFEKRVCVKFSKSVSKARSTSPFVANLGSPVILCLVSCDKRENALRGRDSQLEAGPDPGISLSWDNNARMRPKLSCAGGPRI